MKPRYVQIYFQDEAPRLGCGRRVVELTTGRKWAYCKIPSTGIRARLPVSVIERLRPVEVKVRRKYRKPRPELMFQR